jgi:hypothetical protein
VAAQQQEWSIRFSQVHDSLRQCLKVDGSFDTAKLENALTDLKPEIADAVVE